ncbi:MAG: S9 family peptidase [Pseudomonadota bacterium]
MLRFFLAAFAALTMLAGPARAQQVVDVEQFVADPTYHGGALSPDGKYLAIIQATNDGDMLVLTDIAAHHTTALQRMTARMQGQNGGFNWVAWKGNDHLIVSATAAQVNSYPVTRVFAMNRDGSGLVQMFEGRLNRLGPASTYLLDDLPRDPDHVLMVSYDNYGLGVWRANIADGHVERVVAQDPDTYQYMTDGDGNVVMREVALRDGSGYRIFRRAADVEEWTFVLEARRTEAAPHSPDFAILAGGPAANQVYVFARPDNRDLGALYLYNTATGELGAPVQEGVHADVSDPWITHTGALLATCEYGARLACRARDPQLQRHLDGLDRFFEHKDVVMPISLSEDGMQWLLYAVGPTEPGAYYLYDRAHASIDLLATSYPNLDPETLSPTEVVHYTARDGVDLWAYVTARPGVTGMRPMIVLPHGGPEARDDYGYDSFAQFLASRGYVVLQPNFRGSSGFGRTFANAGHHQWGLRMQEDVTDAVKHMVDAGVADQHRICIVGGSYGGYAALVGAALTPDLYRCAISISGVSDLLEFLRAERDDGTQTINYQYWINSIGDPRTNREQLMATSPRRIAASVHVPVLLVHGEWDSVVPIHQSNLMVDALNHSGNRTRLIRVPQEGHSFYSWTKEHRLMLYNEVEAFLAQNMTPQ